MPKKTKQEKAKEDVQSSVSNDAEAATLSGVFSNDFPIACLQNNLPKIPVKHTEAERPASAEDSSPFCVWIKAESPDEKKLAQLSIRDWKVTPDVVAALQMALSFGTAAVQISTFSLWNVGLSTDSLSALVNLLIAVHCRVLQIGGTPLRSLQPIGDLLNHHQSCLQELELCHCGITDEMLTPLTSLMRAESLKDGAVNSSASALQSLNLNHNRIGDAGVTQLINVLRFNRQLLSLSLSDNQVGDVAAVRLAEVISEFKMVHEEIVLRRKLFAASHQLEWNNLRTLSASPQHRQSFSRRDSTPDFKSAKLAGIVKGAAFAGKTKKAADMSRQKKTEKLSAKSPAVEESRPSHSSSRAQSAKEPHGPLVDGVEQVGVDFVVPGNRTLVFLSLSYNEIGSSGLSQLLKALEHQRDKTASSTTPGLLHLSLKHNLFDENCDEYRQLQELMSSRNPVPSRNVSANPSDQPSSATIPEES